MNYIFYYSDKNSEMDKTGKNIRSSINITKLISDSELTVQTNSRSNSVEDAPIPQVFFFIKKIKF